jgi:hypothetical protein
MLNKPANYFHDKCERVCGNQELFQALGSRALGPRARATRTPTLKELVPMQEKNRAAQV